MKMLGKWVFALALFTGWHSSALAQCQNWNDSPQKETAENAHVIYRPFLKGQEIENLKALSAADFEIAFTNWQTAYKIAPTADGQRNTHYVDGRKLYRAMIDKTTDEAKKKEYANMVIQLYDEQMRCFPDEKNFLLGRKAFDMIYLPGYSYSMASFDAFKTAINAAGNNTEYILLAPLGQLVTYLYQSKQIGKEDVQVWYNKGVEIAEHNIANNARLKTYYESGKANMDAAVTAVESEVFDCGYFKGTLLPRFKAEPDNFDLIEYIVKKLAAQGCAENDPDLTEVKARYAVLNAEIAAERERLRREQDPCFDGTKLQQEGRYQEALSRYRECLESAQDPEVKAQVLYSMASIQTWQLGQYGQARENARTAASLKPGWGKPYILIGDIYAKMSRGGCDSWNQRLAILAAIDKYSYAKSIDGSVAGEASERIGNYAGSMPLQEEGFMRGISAGDTAVVGCGIGETVRIRFQ